MEKNTLSFVEAVTLRRDHWWVEPVLVVIGLGSFIIYSSWAAFQNTNYYVDPYLSPFYSPCISANCRHVSLPLIGSWWNLSPAFLILWAPAGFRLTCYYYRKAYYRSAREVDFFSLGTNDLVQYILIADRGDPAMEPYYHPAHPALLKIIRSVVKAINPAKLAICGEIAGDPFYIELLLGLGLRCFSVVPTEILEVKNTIRSVSLAEAEKLAWEALTMSTGLEVEDSLEKRWQAKNPVLREI